MNLAPIDPTIETAITTLARAAGRDAARALLLDRGTDAALDATMADWARSVGLTCDADWRDHVAAAVRTAFGPLGDDDGEARAIYADHFAHAWEDERATLSGEDVAQ